MYRRSFLLGVLAFGVPALAKEQNIILPSALQRFLPKITPVTQKEMSKLVIDDDLKPWGELGGLVYEAEKTLHFYEARSELDVLSNYLTEIQTGNMGHLQELDAWIGTTYGPSVSCDPVKLEDGVWWKEKLQQVQDYRHHLISSDTIVDKSVAEAYATHYREILNGRYQRGALYNATPEGRILGDFHLHDNATSFSHTDHCATRLGDLSFLISHAYGKKERKYTLYALFQDKEFQLGSFSVVRKL